VSEQSKPTALVVIDVQVAMMEAPAPQPPPFRKDDVLANIRTMLDNARAAGSKVIFVRHMEPNFAEMQPGHPAFEVHPAIAPLPGETVINKTACDSFCGTDLDAILRESGVEHLVTCGMQTDYCVDSATRSAMHRGFNVTLATDAHSTWDNGVLTAEQIVAHHNKTLPDLPGPGTDIFGRASAEIEFAPAGA
jgi:nicotinamidase-related amidase